MRSSLGALPGLVLATGCDRTGPLDPAETAPSLAPHEITHIDDRGGTFELRDLEGCFGELVVVTGTIRYTEHTLTSAETGNQDHMSFTFMTAIPVRSHASIVRSGAKYTRGSGPGSVIASPDHGGRRVLRRS